jgi:hypothetical protein
MLGFDFSFVGFATLLARSIAYFSVVARGFAQISLQGRNAKRNLSFVSKSNPPNVPEDLLVKGRTTFRLKSIYIFSENPYAPSQLLHHTELTLCY